MTALPSKQPVAKIAMEGSKPKELKVMAEAPRGARFDDIVKITLEACLEGGASVCDRMEFTAVARQSIMVLKTSIGHERNVADGVASKAKVGEKRHLRAFLPRTTWTATCSSKV